MVWPVPLKGSFPDAVPRSALIALHHDPLSFSVVPPAVAPLHGRAARSARYDATQDSFLHLKFAVAPCACLAALSALVRYSFDPIELLWTFSIFLEAVAIVPQLIVLQRYREVENLDGHYIFLLGKPFAPALRLHLSTPHLTRP